MMIQLPFWLKHIPHTSTFGETHVHDDEKLRGSLSGDPYA